MTKKKNVEVKEVEVKEVKSDGRGRPARFVGQQLKSVLALLRVHGPTKTQAILAAPLFIGVAKHRKPNPLAALRNSKVFSEPESVSLPTLVKIGKAAGIEQRVGRVNAIEEMGETAVKRAVALVAAKGAVAAGNQLRAEGIAVCDQTLRNMAKAAGVTLHRGRRAA